MRGNLVVCLLILSISITLWGSDINDLESMEKKFGPSYSSFLSNEEQHNPLLGTKTISNSIRGTSWNSYPLYGGEMTSIAIDPNNPQIVYVGTRDAGVYKTRNGGALWSPSRNGLTFYPIRSLAVNPDNSGILYAGTDYDGVWKSVDSGATWVKSSNGLDESLIVYDLAIDPNNPEIIYATLELEKIYKSQDGGSNWIMSDDVIPPLAMDPDNSAILYAGGDSPDFAFRSTDSGKTWFPINDSLTYSPTALAVDPHHSGRVAALTLDIEGNYYIYNGSFWELKSVDYIYINSMFPVYLYFHTMDTSIIYSAGMNFAKSVNGGINWGTYLGYIGSTECSQVKDIAFHPSYPDTIFAATDILFDYDGGVFKSTDQGENWNEYSNGITATVIRSVAIDPQNPSRIYVGGDVNGHFYRTEDGGMTWYHEYLGGEITDIKVDPSNSANIYLASLTGLYKSTDYGDNFIEISAVEDPLCIAINPLHSNTIYVGCSFGYGIYKTTDGGTNWVQKNDNLPESGEYICPILSIAIDPNDTSVIWAGTQYGGGIVKSINGGDYWVSKGLTDENFVDCIAINPDNSNEILVGAGYLDGNIYKSTNGGDTWTKKDSSIAFVFDIKYDPRDPQFVYAATEGYGVLRSTNGGETWHDYSGGIFYPVLYSLDIAQNDSVLLVAGSYASGVYYIHPELSGIDEQKKKDEFSFLRKSFLEISGTSNLIRFNLPKAGMISLKLYDIMGREVAEILNEQRPEGKNELIWNTEKIPAGIYFYHLEFEGISESSKVTFIK